MKHAIRKHIKDVVAILVMVLLAIVIGGYILNKERFPLPFQSSTFTINAEFSTAQAVAPGQGQSVRVSGVQIGLISGVTLKQGVAVVQMQIDQQYQHLIHEDWTALLRPRTGLKDMFIELSPPPGGSRLAVVKPGDTMPVSNTLPDINVDEILAALDADSRAYLMLLVNGAGQGLKDNGGNELAQVLERFLPTHRDLARVSKAIAERGSNLRRLVNSLALLNSALAARQNQLAQLVDSSSTVFTAFGSEEQTISRSLADLPGTLTQATTTLGQVQTFADQLGPTAQSLQPAAQALPAANEALATFAKPATPIIQNQIRPFVVAAKPVVGELSPAAANLAEATPNLQKSFVVLNHLVNMLGFFPGGGQHGYLWWLAWLGHNTRTLFSIQDANGAYRPLFIQFSCSQISQLTGAGSPFSLVGSLLNLAPLRKFCPGLGSLRATPSHGVLRPPPPTTSAH